VLPHLLYSVHYSLVNVSNSEYGPNEIDLASEELRCAKNALEKIVGHVGVEEILGDIFKKFCIGK
jgi:tRNA modification GTPase